VDDDGGASVAEERVGAVAEGYVAILESDSVGLALDTDGEVSHVAGVVAFGIIESVLLALRIEMRTGGFEIGRIALGVLMEVDGVLAGRQVVEMEFEFNARSVIPEDHPADALALGVLEFDYGFGGAGEREKNHGGQGGDCGEGYGLHAGNYNEFAGAGTNGPCLIHRKVEYTAAKFEIFQGKCAIMTLNAVEPVEEQVAVDDFQALEEKVYRTIEMYKAARQAQAAAERDAQRMRQQLEERDEQLVTLRREAVLLRKEREEIRGRVEKMLEQIESIAEEQAS